MGDLFARSQAHKTSYTLQLEYLQFSLKTFQHETLIPNHGLFRECHYDWITEPVAVTCLEASSYN